MPEHSGSGGHHDIRAVDRLEPRIARLDSVGTGDVLYELIRTELPDTIVISVSHRNTVHRFHHRHLELTGEGRW